MGLIFFQAENTNRLPIAMVMAAFTNSLNIKKAGFKPAIKFNTTYYCILHLVVTDMPNTLAEASFDFHCASASLFLAVITKLESTEIGNGIIPPSVVVVHLQV